MLEEADANEYCSIIDPEESPTSFECDIPNPEQTVKKASLGKLIVFYGRDPEDELSHYTLLHRGPGTENSPNGRITLRAVLN